jgi:hypothetical protein
MKAIEAKRLSDEHNEVNIHLQIVINTIEKAARAGNYHTTVGIDGDLSYDINAELQRLGYMSEVISQQTDPNSSDYFLSISWR